MKRLILLFICVVAYFFVSGQTDIKKTAEAKDLSGATAVPDSLKAWKFGGNGLLNISQAAFSNWAAGGENSLGLDAALNLKANYRKGRHAWVNSLDLAYGFQYLGIGDNAEFRKTNDKLEFNTAYGYQITEKGKWLYTGLVNFKTQFAPGFSYPDDSTVISKFMAPGYLLAGLGITYAPVKWVYFYLSPASVRMTFVYDDSLSAQGQFGVDPGKNIKTEFGAYFRADMNKDLAKNINLASTLELYTNYLKDFGNIDVNWNVLLTMKVNKWLAASINTQLIYDDDINISNQGETGGPKTQFKELIGVGITYMIQRK
jgi:hypothetical protein